MMAFEFLISLLIFSRCPSPIRSRIIPRPYIDLKLTPKNKFLNVSTKEFKSIPTLVQMEVPETDFQNFQNSTKEVDFMLVIDTSSSIAGEKIKLVKESVDYLLDRIQERDRLALVKFSTKATKVIDFTHVNKSNKLEIKNLVNENLVPSTSANIGDALTLSIDMIRKRKNFSRKVAFLFLSDGRDDMGNSINSIVKKMSMLSQAKEVKGLHVCSFGYGHDHDSKMLLAIPRPNEGKFYYVDKIRNVDISIINCLSEMLTFYLKDLEIHFRAFPNISLEVRKSHSDNVKKIGNVLTKTINHIAVVRKINILTDLFIDLKKVTCMPGESLPVMVANLRYKLKAKEMKQDVQLWLECVVKEKESILDTDLEEELDQDSFLFYMEKAKEIPTKTGDQTEAKRKLLKYAKFIFTDTNLEDAYKRNRDDFLSANPLEDANISNMNDSVKEEEFISFESGDEQEHLLSFGKVPLEENVLKKQAEKEFDESL